MLFNIVIIANLVDEGKIISSLILHPLKEVVLRWRLINNINRKKLIREYEKRLKDTISLMPESNSDNKKSFIGRAELELDAVRKYGSRGLKNIVDERWATPPELEFDFSSMPSKVGL
jgi:hypothetical protein